ncbi:MAG: hypothetical protein CML22_07230 [Rheinheimera sp.]|nr:hypothetical protein [Rheinheimera sp.]MBM34076.1 hypothetical protein [Rheinheimera sp.]|tara:strand:+ start:293 stop:484 length:192 start_codon:yes stop_codon:yes gene_type:complete
MLIIKSYAGLGYLIMAAFKDGVRISERYTVSHETAFQYHRETGRNISELLKATITDDHKRGLF